MGACPAATGTAICLLPCSIACWPTPASVRVAHRLWMIAEGYGEIDGSRRVVQLAQEDLAAMLGVSRQTTNALLKALQEQGVVRLGYGEIEILDAQRLREMAQG